MRTLIAVLILATTLALLILLLTREDTSLWQLTALSGAAGLISFGIRWGWRGAVLGGVVGIFVGMIMPLLYLPFWLAFTLPPHPQVDL
jgi:hypothetical protein